MDDERYSAAWRDLKWRNRSAWAAGLFLLAVIVGSPFLRGSVGPELKGWVFWGTIFPVWIIFVYALNRRQAFDCPRCGAKFLPRGLWRTYEISGVKGRQWYRSGVCQHCGLPTGARHDPGDQWWR
jgi:hypothetical protein